VGDDFYILIPEYKTPSRKAVRLPVGKCKSALYLVLRLQTSKFDFKSVCF